MIVVVEVKTKETKDVLKREHVDQIGGHRIQYQKKYPDRPVYPVVFTNKSEISSEAVEKAKGNVRILRSSEFVTLMTKYIELMAKGWNIEEPAERVAFIERIPSLENFENLFKSSEDPIVTLDDINSCL